MDLAYGYMGQMMYIGTRNEAATWRTPVIPPRGIAKALRKTERAHARLQADRRCCNLGAHT